MRPVALALITIFLLLSACNGKIDVPPPPAPGGGGGGPGKPVDAVTTFLDSLKAGEAGWEKAMAVLGPDLEKSFRSMKKKSPDKPVITVLDYAVGSRQPGNPGEILIQVKLREKRSQGERVSRLTFTVKRRGGTWAIAAIAQSGTAANTPPRARLEATLQSIALSMAAYKADNGDWPPSTLKALGIEGANRTNEGIESLVVSLAARQGRKAYIAWHPNFIKNLDEDQARVGDEKVDAAPLVEVVDPWGTPVIYMHNRDYGKPQSYTSRDGSTFTLTARKKGDAYLAPEAYQLWSLGPDGKAGTGDDIVWQPGK